MLTAIVQLARYQRPLPETKSDRQLSTGSKCIDHVRTCHELMADCFHQPRVHPPPCLYARLFYYALNVLHIQGYYLSRMRNPGDLKQLSGLLSHGDDVGLKTGWFTEGNGWGLGWCVVRQPQGVTAMLSPGSFGHGGAYGTQAWIDPVRQAIYILMVQRANFPNADNSEARLAFQAAAVRTLDSEHHR